MINSPEFTDDLIRSKVRRQLGPAIQDPTSLMAAHSAKQLESQANMENYGRRNQMNQLKFDRAYGLARDDLRTSKRLGDTSALLAAGNMAYGLYDKGVTDKMAAAEMQRRKEYDDEMKAMIQRMLPPKINTY